jgi:FtsP/CotA-like multicopper oxidase with cupredoxin domain
MRSFISSNAGWLAFVGLSVAVASTAALRAPDKPVVRPNANTTRAGVLRGGVLTVSLEAKPTLWYLDGPDRPPEIFAAFAESGKAPLMPGPLVRAAAGTELRLSIHNELSKPLTFYIPAAIGGSTQAMALDSAVIAPGATGQLQSKALVPGNYVYRASLPGYGRHRGISGLLAGALVIDTAGAPARAHDRVIVVMEAADSAFETCADTVTGNAFGGCLAVPLRPAVTCASACPIGRGVNTINGESWPNTERIRATVDDSLHWRVINASADVHPMHLHGFYYRVDAFDGPWATFQGRPAPGQMVVTQLMTPWSGMSITWSPNKPGNWLFHCHFAMHNTPDSISAMSDDPHERMMSGLVLGTIVTGRPGVVAAGEPAAGRHLRLVAVEDSDAAIANGRAVVPSMRFVLEDGARREDAGVDFSPELDLMRDEPVAITIVNHLAEPTSVHWHGIEIQDSYADGVPGFSGSGHQLTPAIAPGDSFVARFTPPRAGTFMYHAHVDEVREQVGGLEGALIVRDRGVNLYRDDFTFFLKESRRVSWSGPAPRPAPPEINGHADPDTIVLHAGQPARLRLLNLGTRQIVAVPIFRLVESPGPERTVAETTDVEWRPIAKDGFDRPASARAARPASQIISMGETYDFEYTPRQRGVMRLEVLTFVAPGSPAKHRLLVAVPIRVE